MCLFIKMCKKNNKKQTNTKTLKLNIEKFHYSSIAYTLAMQIEYFYGDKEWGKKTQLQVLVNYNLI